MNPQELRIGNIVLFNGSVVDKGIGYGAIQDIAQKHKGLKNEYLDTITFEPIPLTQEWLLKFGFDNTETGWEIIYRKRFKFSVILFKKVASVGMAGPFGLFEVKLKYVHQLQNLYFALTGEELAIKE